MANIWLYCHVHGVRSIPEATRWFRGFIEELLLYGLSIVSG